MAGRPSSPPNGEAEARVSGPGARASGRSGLRVVSQADLARFQRFRPDEFQRMALLHIFEQRRWIDQ